MSPRNYGSMHVLIHRATTFTFYKTLTFQIVLICLWFIIYLK